MILARLAEEFLARCPELIEGFKVSVVQDLLLEELPKGSGKNPVFQGDPLVFVNAVAQNPRIGLKKCAIASHFLCRAALSAAAAPFQATAGALSLRLVSCR
jgi:hypothetical protein